MRGVLFVALGVLFLAATAFSGTRSSSARPAVRVADFSPFVVRGAGFRADERVTVVAQVQGRHVKAALSGARGGFTVRFAAVSIRGCAGYLVRATGSKGSRAYLRHVPECPSG
jgi:hypothetical protein